MTDRERYDVALSFWTTALQYLALVDNAARETVSQGNTWVLLRDLPITADEYEEATRWSDHTIIMALLFSLFHGIELLAKGFLLAGSGEPVEKGHNPDKLRQKIEARYPNETALIEFLCKYTSADHMPELLRRFMQDNGLNVERLYEALRYPSPDFVTIRRYSSLKYEGQEGTTFFADLHVDIELVRLAAVDLGRRLEPKLDPAGG
jgi:hypothetical protein